MGRHIAGQAPERASIIWVGFLRPHTEALLACDFMETLTGARRYVLAVIEHHTRRIRVSDESLVKDAPGYERAVKVVFVHQIDTGNAYTCDQSPQVVRSILTHHVTRLGWNAIGYNFLVDKCGTLFEGRAGGAVRPVHVAGRTTQPCQLRFTRIPERAVVRGVTDGFGDAPDGSIGSAAAAQAR